MEKHYHLRRSQLPKILLLVAFLSLLLLTPFISPSMRPSYLYFLLNLLIISLGVEAGFLAAISGGHRGDDKKAVAAAVVSLIAVEAVASVRQSTDGCSEETVKEVAEKPAVVTEKKVAAVAPAAAQKAVKRCPSRPSLFFIGGWDGEEVNEEEEEEEEEVVVVKEVEEVTGELSKQELFAKAEMFIGNFYKQLKMQREESWKKIHGLYHRAF